MSNHDDTSSLVALLSTAIQRAKETDSEAMEQRRKQRDEYAAAIKNADSIITRGIAELRGCLHAANHTATVISTPREVTCEGVQVQHLGTFRVGTPLVLSVRWAAQSTPDGDIFLCLYSIDREQTWTPLDPMKPSAFTPERVDSSVRSIIRLAFASQELLEAPQV